MPSVQPRPSARPLHPSARLAFRAGDCASARFPGTGCRRCAAACPAGALTMTARGPRLDGDCLHCGRCVAACPSEALSLPGCAPTPSDGPALLDCWRVPSADSPSGALRVPCLGGLSAATLVELTAKTGDAVVLLDRGCCPRCPAGRATDPAAAHPAAAAVLEVQALFRDSGLAPERWPRLASLPLSPHRMATHGGEPLLETRLSRRALFGGGRAAPSVPSAMAMEQETRRGQPVGLQRLRAALSRLLPPGQPLPARLFPRLTANAACADHRICASACPSGALRPDAEDAALGLTFRAADCLACGTCVQVCPEQALTLETGADAERVATMPERQILTRHAARACPDCGRRHAGSADRCSGCQRDRDFARQAFRTLFGASSPA